ncbi:alpha/beta fold hydrolase [Actinomadura parmotrematis]|uniref:Alpha/beta hydrolase n=1 Tax=Actinomadura parmotrematis TaxID=2864039 RepID=A0ABS7FZA8_9ACTN|nr:alpha/beta hydrolase [Actinomadura parmotrematis]MBW8485781.1 alpha/beta hydrolase [Actinomadura parmotrematis]
MTEPTGDLDAAAGATGATALSAVPAGLEAVVEAGGERVHLTDTGRPDGPTLLITNGLGGAGFDWRAVVERLSGAYRIVLLDRPGLGLSPAAQAPPSLRRDVAVLADVAAWTGGPVTVLAHSMGGFHAEALARQWPALVSALVLVDPSYEADARPPAVRFATLAAPVAQAAGSALGATGLLRLAGPAGRRFAMRFTSSVPDATPDAEVRAVYGRGTVLGTMLTENIAYREMAADLAGLRERLPFPPVPLVVLTALGDVDGDKARREWASGHARLAAMTPLGRQVELTDSLHMVQIDRPDAVADAVAAVHEGRA